MARRSPGETPSYRSVIPACLARRSTASANGTFSIRSTKWKAFPPAPHPKQWKTCLEGLTPNEAVFSVWKGHRPA
jgi:hypothetical protein